MFHKEYLTQTMLQSDELYQYLCKDEFIQKILNYIYDPRPKEFDETKTAHLSFLSFRAISECHPDLTEKLISNKNYVNRLFSLIRD